MFRQSNSLVLYFIACAVVIAMLAGCDGNSAPGTPVSTSAATAAATNTSLLPTLPPPTATIAGSDVEATPTLEPNTPTTEAEAATPVDTPAMPATTTADTPTTTAAATVAPTRVPQSSRGPCLRTVTSSGKSKMSPADAERTIKQRAEAAIQALKNKNMPFLAGLVHPEKGVCFSPYGYVDETNLQMTPQQLSEALADPTVSKWGAYDGTGDPINLTFADYYDTFIYNHDFAAAPDVSYNAFKGHGNTVVNLLDVYPDGIAVEYHFPGFDPQYEGMDWESLYLVFEQHDQDENWYLVHIAHGQWTI